MWNTSHSGVVLGTSKRHNDGATISDQVGLTRAVRPHRRGQRAVHALTMPRDAARRQEPMAAASPRPRHSPAAPVGFPRSRGGGGGGGRGRVVGASRRRRAGGARVRRRQRWWRRVGPTAAGPAAGARHHQPGHAGPAPRGRRPRVHWGGGGAAGGGAHCCPLRPGDGDGRGGRRGTHLPALVADVTAVVRLVVVLALSAAADAAADLRDRYAGRHTALSAPLDSTAALSRAFFNQVHVP